MEDAKRVVDHWSEKQMTRTSMFDSYFKYFVFQIEIATLCRTNLNWLTEIHKKAAEYIKRQLRRKLVEKWMLEKARICGGKNGSKVRTHKKGKSSKHQYRKLVEKWPDKAGWDLCPFFTTSYAVFKNGNLIHLHSLTTRATKTTAEDSSVHNNIYPFPVLLSAVFLCRVFLFIQLFI